MRRALIVGASGQDGSYLSEQLIADGTEVYGFTREGFRRPGGGLAPIHIGDRTRIRELIGETNFDEIYYLAAYHHSADQQAGDDLDIARQSFAVHVDGLLNILDGMVACKSSAGIFYAASSHVFGVVTQKPQNEQTPLMPICPYGVSKTAGIQLCRLYRQDYGIRASVGYLYNHESPRRALRFLSRKVARAVCEIERGNQEDLLLGDLEAEVDWGYSPEYTDAMRRILARDGADDFVVASGRSMAVRTFVEAAFTHAGLDWRRHISINPSLIKKVNRGPLVGDSRKLLNATGWSAVTTIEKLAAMMVDAERKQVCIP